MLHDVGSQDGISYLVMECVDGETLAKRLEKGPLPLDQVLKYGMQIADALDKAHRSGVVHRDLKPGNIMLTPAGAKLLDFGLAKPAVTLVTAATLTVTTPRSPVTEQGTIVGTFQYMSPEQVEGKEPDGRSDIFSLGAVLYEMLTGQRAFEGKSQLSVASAILEKDPSPISTVKPMTPPALDHAIRRCLAKNPEERWQSAGDIKGELLWIAEAGSQAGVSTALVSHRKVRERLTQLAVAILALLDGPSRGQSLFALCSVGVHKKNGKIESIVRVLRGVSATPLSVPDNSAGIRFADCWKCASGETLDSCSEFGPGPYKAADARLTRFVD